MTEAVALPARAYRAVDVGTKLVGVGIVAAALETGIGSTAGIALAFVGAALAVCTVFVTEVDS